MQKNSLFKVMGCAVVLLLCAGASAQSPARSVSTFHSIGLYWSPANGSSDVKCRVNYRRADELLWHAAQDLWFDDRALDGRLAEYRGSIVNLQPGTEYMVQLWLEDDFRTEVMFSATTWSESFPIAKIVQLPEHSTEMLTISESGTESGYVLYVPQPGRQSVIDGERRELFNILLEENTHHIIIRGLMLCNAARHGIRISDNCHDIVIEECDISSWGSMDESGFGENLNAAISAAYRANNIERLIIQNNYIHHPHTDANSWGESRPNSGGDPFHPQGPYGLVFYDTRGNHVIRHNRFETDDDHYFADILGAGSNISFKGFPNKDSDIYGNHFERCWDDAVESEGANENVRIWDNYFDHVYHPIGVIVTSIGPLYIWRNIVSHSRKYANIPNSDYYGRGEFIKCGSVEQDGVYYGDGRMYVYHNTVLQPDAPGSDFPLGCEGALVAEGKALHNAVSRNNIFTNYKLDSYTFRDNVECDDNHPANDFDFDLYTGEIKVSCEEMTFETYGIHLAANELIKYNDLDPAGIWALLPGSPGHDAGCLLPNFNDNFIGRAPDMGAVESRLSTRVGKAMIKPSRMTLQPSFPNPFKNSTHFVFNSMVDMPVTVFVYSLTGVVVKKINVLAVPGQNKVYWDGCGENGRELPSGLYIVRLQHGKRFTALQKIVRLR